MIAHLFNLSGQDHLPLPCFLIGNNDVLVKSYESEMIQSGVVGCFNFVFLKKKLPTTPLCQILTNILSFESFPRYLKTQDHSKVHLSFVESP